MSELAIEKTIDHTILKADAPRSKVEQVCREALEYHFASVCVNPVHVPYVARLLKGSDVKTCTVIGFPLGATTSATKAFEAKEAVANGAQEVDMVLNIGALKDGDREFVYQDIKAVVDAAGAGALVKVILETGLLTDEEKVTACKLAEAAGASFVKTSTGFGNGVATVEDVALMRKTVGESVQVKASSGIRTYENALSMLRAGATRLGTSAGRAILEGYRKTL